MYLSYSLRLTCNHGLNIQTRSASAGGVLVGSESECLVMLINAKVHIKMKTNPL